MGKCGKGLTLAFFLFSLICPADVCQAEEAIAGFPLIKRLDSRDESFKQLIADVEVNRRRVFLNNISAVFLTVYQYTPGEGEDLFALAARCSIPYSALATLNRIEHPSMLGAGKPLLLPSAPGIFVPQEPVSDLERLLALSLTSGDTGNEADEPVMRINGTAFAFFPGKEFGATERAFFLNTGFSLPLRSYRLTSGYGVRKNPVTGNVRLHEGLDLAAPLGTEVYAAANGIVTEIGEDIVYGNYIIIKHSGDWASLYGHLQKIDTTLRSSVKSGMLIGRVGSTGQSTGPHLHFELRQNGKARDPDKYLFLPGGRS